MKTIEIKNLQASEIQELDDSELSGVVGGALSDTVSFYRKIGIGVARTVGEVPKYVLDAAQESFEENGLNPGIAVQLDL